MKKRKGTLNITISITDEERKAIDLSYKHVRLRNKSLKINRSDFVRRAVTMIEDPTLLKLLGYKLEK